MGNLSSTVRKSRTVNNFRVKANHYLDDCLAPVFYSAILVFMPLSSLLLLVCHPYILKVYKETYSKNGYIMPQNW